MAGTLDGDDDGIAIFVQALGKQIGGIVLRLTETHEIGGTVGCVGLRLESLRDEGEVGVEAEVEQCAAYGLGVRTVLQNVGYRVLGIL